MTVFTDTEKDLTQVEALISSLRDKAEPATMDDITGIDDLFALVNKRLESLTAKAKVRETDPDRCVFGPGMCEKVKKLAERAKGVNADWECVRSLRFPEADSSARAASEAACEEARLERERQDEAREKREREKRERERVEKEEAEKTKREEEMRLKEEKERMKREREEREKAEKERMEREKEEKEKAEKEKEEREKAKEEELRAKEKEDAERRKRELKERTEEAKAKLLAAKEAREKMQKEQIDKMSAAAVSSLSGSASPNASASASSNSQSSASSSSTPAPASSSGAPSLAAPGYALTPTKVIEVISGRTELELIRRAAGASKLVVVDYSAPWCGPCKALAPAFANLARKYPGAVLVKVDTEASPENRTHAVDEGIRSLPTIKFFLGETLVDTITGANPVKIEQAMIKHGGASISVTPDTPPAGAAGGASGSSAAGGSASSTPGAPITKGFLSALSSFKAKVSADQFTSGVQTLITYVSNIVDHPSENKYRRIRKGNRNFMARIGSLPGGVECMTALGFVETQLDADGEPYLVLEGNGNIEELGKIRNQLKQVVPAAPAAGSTPGAGAANPLFGGLGGLGGLGGGMFPPMFGNPGNGADGQAPGGAPGAPGAGGAGPFGSNPFSNQLLQDPALLQQMMNDPAVNAMTQRLMQDPEFMQSMMQGMESGGMPDYQTFMQSPAAQRVMADMMQQRAAGGGFPNPFMNPFMQQQPGQPQQPGATQATIPNAAAPQNPNPANANAPPAAFMDDDAQLQEAIRLSMELEEQERKRREEEEKKKE